MISSFESYFSGFNVVGGQVPFTICVVISLIFAALNTLFGYKLRKLWATLIGVIIGFFIGFVAGFEIWGNSGAALIAGLVLALAVGALAFFIYKAGIFLMCAVSAYALLYSIICFTMDSNLAMIISIIFGIVIGVLSVIFLRPFIIVTTAVGGGFSFAQSLFTLFPPTSGTSTILGLSWPIFLVGAVMAIIGIIVQFVTTKKHGKR